MDGTVVQTHHINMLQNADTEYINKKMREGERESAAENQRRRGADELISTQEMSRILEMTHVTGNNTTIVQ